MLGLWSCRTLPLVSPPHPLGACGIHSPHPKSHLAAIFEAVGAAVDALYSGPEAFEVAQAYVKAAKLEGAPDNRTLLLDAALCDALFKGVVKKGEIFPTTLPKAGGGRFLRAALCAILLVCHICRGSPPSLPPWRCC